MTTVLCVQKYNMCCSMLELIHIMFGMTVASLKAGKKKYLLVGAQPKRDEESGKQ